MRSFSTLIVFTLLASVLVTMTPTESVAGNRWVSYRMLSSYSPWHVHKCCVPYDDREKMTICHGRPVPPGWVVVGRRKSMLCTGHGLNSLIIQRLSNMHGAELTICGDQPIPPGWAIVGESRTIHCGRGNVAVRIRKL